MKTASEVAEEILSGIPAHWLVEYKKRPDFLAWLSGKVAAYAEERVKESERIMLITSIARGAEIRSEACAKALMEAKTECESFHANNEDVEILARAEALEEAAKIANEFDGGTVHRPYDWVAVKTGIAKEIRALKDKL